MNISRLKFDLSDLSSRILDTVDQSLFERDDTKFLDPSIGGGQFIKAIEERLRAHGHSDANIAKRVFGFATNLLDIGFAVNKHKLVAEIKQDSVIETDIGMHFDLILMNPPYNSEDTSRDYTSHRGQGDNLARKFAIKGLELLAEGGKMVCVMPYGQRTYSSKLAKDFVKGGLYKIEDASDSFPQVSTNPCAFYFDKEQKVEDVSQVDDQYKAHDLSIPEKNIGQIFKNQPGCLNRVDYEGELSDSGSYRIVVTTAIQKYTDNEDIVNGLADPTTGNWRVVMNCTTVKGGWGKLIVEGPESHLSKSVHALICSSEEEARNLKEYLETDEVREILAKVKLNACNSKKFLEFIPLP